MILYRVAVSIQHSREAEWRQWMQEVHIPDVLHTGHFVQATFCSVLEPDAPEGHANYSITYACNSLEALRTYQRDCAAALQADHTEKFKGFFSATRTILEEIQSYSVGPLA